MASIIIDASINKITDCRRIIGNKYGTLGIHSNDGIWYDTHTFILKQKNSDGTVDGTAHVLVFVDVSNVVYDYSGVSLPLSSSPPSDSLRSSQGTYTGTLPSDYIMSTQSYIDKQYQELYKSPGTLAEFYDSNYQTSMLTGIFVAMLGTTVLFYVFKNV